MAKSKKNDEKPAKDQDEPKKGDVGGTEQQRPRNPNADPVRIHRDFVDRRLGGGAPATREAYDSALDEWHRLPGAVTRSPTEIRGPDRKGEAEPKKDPNKDDAQTRDEGGDKERKP